jgi:DNA polymerase I-like protein with 3'-5' exonuclease and polymerase domains
MLPEKGHVLLEADLSQVEGRLCFIYTGDAELIRLARLRASEFDQHNFVVSILDRKPGTIFGLPLDELPAKSDERQASKSLMHAFQRDMQAQTAVDTLLRQDERFIYTVDETKAMLDILRRKLPAIPAWHAETRKTVRRDHCLTSSWGHTWDVRYDEINDDLFRRAYSWKMQRDAAGLLNMQGFIPLDRWLKKEKMQSLAMFQVHDSLVCSCSLNEAYDIALFLKDHLEAPREYDGTELSVPVEFSVGKNYGNKIEMQELPDRADFDKIALTCIA